MTYGWLRTNFNQEGIEIWELETEELFYHAPSNLIIGIFQKDLTNELYEKAKGET